MDCSIYILGLLVVHPWFACCPSFCTAFGIKALVFLYKLLKTDLVFTTFKYMQKT